MDEYHKAVIRYHGEVKERAIYPVINEDEEDWLMENNEGKLISVNGKEDLVKQIGEMLEND